MIISQTPIRLSFLGGGTDYPVHFRRHGGATLSATIDKYTTITVHRLTSFVPCKLRIHYSTVEAVDNLDDVKHPSARECLRYLGIREGVEIHYVSNLPSRTGLGSSSSSTVGLLAALHAFQGRVVCQEELASQAVHVEQQMIHERVGVQDQYSCALGGFLFLEYKPDGAVRVNRIPVSSDTLTELESRLVLLFTGIQRTAHEVLDEQLDRTESGSNRVNLARLKVLAECGLGVLTAGNGYSEFGELLHEAWMLKRQLSRKVSLPYIDECYERARRAGAIGGKLLGAGGGGFLLLYVEPDRRDDVCAALAELPEVRFEFEGSGCQISYYRP